jgi:hypothetical protein
MARSPALDRKEQALAQIYRDAVERITAQVADDLASGRLGTARYRQARLDALRQLLSATQDAAIPAATELIGAAYIEGATSAARAVKASTPTFGTGFHREAMEILADNLTSSLNGAAEQVGRRVEDAYRRAGLEAATNLLTDGETLRSGTGDLVSLLRGSGLDAGPGGAASWRLDRYAEMVVRTNTTDAVVRGNINEALADGYDIVEVLVVDDEQLCEICGPYTGKVYSLTGATPGLEQLPDQPPFHPNCRCDLNILTAEPGAGADYSAVPAATVG